MSYFRSFVVKPFSVSLLFFLLVFAFISCDTIPEKDMLNSSIETTQDKNGITSVSSTEESETIPPTAIGPIQPNPVVSSQTIQLKDIPNAIKSYDEKPVADLIVTLLLENSFTLSAINSQGDTLPVKATSADESIAFVQGNEVFARQAGVTILTVKSKDENYTPLTVQVVVPPKLELFTPIGEGWWYKQIVNDSSLSAKEKQDMLELYKLFLQKPGTAFAKGSASIVTLPGAKLTYSQLQTVYWAVKLDYPELFWLKSTFIPLYDEDFKYYGLGTESIFTSLEDFTTKNDELKTAANKFLSDIGYKLRKNDSKGSLYAIYEKLSTIKYDYDVLANPMEANRWEVHSAYGALVENFCVCDGYSSAIAYLVRKLQKEYNILSNVYLTMVVGNPADRAKSPGHAWNAFILDGTWYELDTTFATTQGCEKNFMKNNEDREFLLQHNLDVGYKFLTKYIPFAQNRIKLYKYYTGKN